MDLIAATLMAAVTLALPGPTNALLGVAGSVQGFRRSLSLILAVLSAYALGIGVLAAAAAPLIAVAPRFGTVLRLFAALVLVHAAMHLWRRASLGQSNDLSTLDQVGWWHVFLTTLSNPKVLVLYVLALPDGATPSASVLPFLVALALLIPAAAIGWIAFGASVRSNFPALVEGGLLERAGAGVLVTFAFVLTTSALSEALP